MHSTQRSVVAVLAAALLAPPSVTAQGGWQTVANAPGRFSITVPAPLSPDKPVTDPNGVVSHTFVASVDGKAYVVAYADGAIANWRAEMDAARDALLKGLDATLVSEHRFKSAQPVGDIEATEFTCRSQTAGTECKARSFWYKSRLYMIGVLYRSGTGSSLDTD